MGWTAFIVLLITQVKSAIKGYDKSEVSALMEGFGLRFSEAMVVPDFTSCWHRDFHPSWCAGAGAHRASRNLPLAH